VSAAAPVAAAPAVPSLPGVRDVRYADAGGVDVAWVALGAGPPDVLLLNPGLISIDGLADEAHLAAGVAHLAERARVVAFDRRGTGLSGRAGDPPGLDEWTAAAAAVLDAAGSAAAVVFANSDTGLLAIALAAAYPDRVLGLVIVHGYARFVRAPDYPYGYDGGTASAMSDEALATGDAPGRFDPLALIAPSVAGDPGFRRWWDALGRRAASPSAAAALHRLIHAADVRDRLAAVAAPVLLVRRRSCAGHDVGHARHLADHLADARLVELAGADELWFTGDVDPLLAEVDRFVARLGAAPMKEI
jgi:pimeloyl-ACP methyl ester carboxylesterase